MFFENLNKMEAYHPTKGRINEKEYILCAAIKRIAPRECYHKGNPYWEGTNDILNIEIGYRHHDIFMRFGPEVISKKPSDQGFYTSKGRFVSREEGMRIAKECGQVTDEQIHSNELFSEDLY